MNFYFYTNKNVLFDFLGRNIIAPDPIVKDIKRYRTISTASDYFLFVTNKKLDRKSREQGIAEPEFVYPVTLQLTDSQESDGQAVLVSRTKSGFKYTLAPLTKYDVKKHIGAYLLGEIPLSRVDKIYFDTQDDMDMFSRPSPDYWYPTNKYDLLPDDFTEELIIELEQDKITTAANTNPEDIIAGIRKREKERAAILNFINETRRWQCENYVFNIDSGLQSLLDLKDEQIAEFLPHYLEMKDKGLSEHLSLCESDNQSQEINQIIFDDIKDMLIQQPYNTQKQPDLIVEILNNLNETLMGICKKSQEKSIIKKSIAELVNLITDASNKSPEEIMTVIPEPVDVLKALLFVVKNPNRYELFLESLDAYHADQLTKRRAAVLWGSLNGLYGMPGEDFNKDNQPLWQFIEADVYAAGKNDLVSLSVLKPDMTLNKGTVLGLQLKEERIITAAETRRTILEMPKEKLSKAFYEKLLDAAVLEYGSKKKAENKGYTHSTASIDLTAIKAGDELTPSIKKKLAQLIKDSKVTVPNKEKLFKDYVETEGKFDLVFNMDPEYWKRAIRISAGQKNGR